jgi:hypothetical protein
MTYITELGWSNSVYNMHFLCELIVICKLLLLIAGINLPLPGIPIIQMLHCLE